MALIHPDSRCPICHDRLDRPFTATSGMAFPPGHRLSRYCDAPLHFDCLATWPEREEFSEAYFVGKLAHYWRGGSGTLLTATDRWFLACGPSVGQTPYFAEVTLREWPFRLYSEWGMWTEYVDSGFRQHLAGGALAAAESIMTEVRRYTPTTEALEALLLTSPPPPNERRSFAAFGTYLATLWGDHAYRIDWQARDEEERAFEQYLERRERHRSLAIAESNELARELLRELESSGKLRCRHCQRESYDFRFIEKGPSEKSYFICGLCGRSFAGSETS